MVMMKEAMSIVEIVFVVVGVGSFVGSGSVVVVVVVDSCLVHSLRPMRMYVSHSYFYNPS
jgi:hypothetical protein